MEDRKLIDFYELTMAYSDFKDNRVNDIVYFDVFFRKNIDNSGYSIFGGLEEIVDYLNNVIKKERYEVEKENEFIRKSTGVAPKQTEGIAIDD